MLMPLQLSIATNAWAQSLLERELYSRRDKVNVQYRTRNNEVRSSPGRYLLGFHNATGFAGGTLLGTSES